MAQVAQQHLSGTYSRKTSEAEACKEAVQEAEEEATKEANSLSAEFVADQGEHGQAQTMQELSVTDSGGDIRSQEMYSLPSAGLLRNALDPLSDPALSWDSNGNATTQWLSEIKF